jgi:hypothetical protein
VALVVDDRPHVDRSELFLDAQYYPKAQITPRRGSRKRPDPPLSNRRAGTCHDQGGALIMTKTILVEAVTRRSGIQKRPLPWTAE